MKETIKIIRPENLPALVLILVASAFVGCTSQKNVAATQTASTPNSAANIAVRTTDAESSKLEPIERPFFEEPENVRPARDADSSKIVTKANFDRIKIGMSYKEAVVIFGDKGIQTSTMKVNNRETTIFKWTVPDFSKYIDLHFENDKVIKKKQKGLI